MEWKDYVKWTDTTAVYPEAGLGSDLELCYIALGLAGEVGELNEQRWYSCPKEGLERDKWDERVKSELGDCFWYIARGYRALEKHDLSPVAHRSGIDRSLTQPALLLGNEAKKLLRDGVSQHRLIRVRNLLDRAFVAASLMLNSTGPDYDFELPELLDLNVQKLTGRKDRGSLHGSGEER